MPRDHRLYLDDIVGAIDRIQSYVEGMDHARFAVDQRTIVQTKLEPLRAACRNALADGSRGPRCDTPDR